MILFYFYHPIVKYPKQPCMSKKKKRERRKTEDAFFFFFLQDFFKGSTRGSLNVR